jgi:hypothetical protein
MLTYILKIVKFLAPEKGSEVPLDLNELFL